MKLRYREPTQAFLFRVLFILLLSLTGLYRGHAQEIKGSDSETLVLKSLEKKFDVSITVDASAYRNNEAVQKNIEENVDALNRQEGLEGALDILLKDSGLEYEKVNKAYYVIRRQENHEEKGASGAAQTSTLSGLIRDKENGEGLPGVNVYFEESGYGTITNATGYYELAIDDQHRMLVVSYIGYKTMRQEISQTGTALNLDLEADIFGLDEVVVSGVASHTSRKNLSISVTKVKEEDIKAVPPSSASSALTGKVAGITVVQGNGQPGTGSAIRFRGSTSLTGNQSPLIIVDGSVISISLADINADDIESMEVVKGAAASALYGSRAGNGVIVITTRRGKSLQQGKTSVLFRQEIGIQELSKKIETTSHHPYLLDEDWQDYDYTRYAGVFYKEDGTKLSGSRSLAPGGFADQPFYKLYDHQDLFFSKGAYRTTYVSIAGNTSATNFMVSYEHNQQEGIIAGTNGYKRNNLKFNLDHKLSKHIELSTSNMFIKTFSQDPGNSWNAFKDLLFISPDVDLTEPNPDGSPYKIKPDQWDEINENPLYPIYYRDRTTEKMAFLGNTNIRIHMTPWMNFEGKYTYEYRENYNQTLTPKGYLGGNEQSIEGALYRDHYNSFNQNFQATLNIHKQLDELTVKLKLSYLYENNAYRDDNTTGRDFVVASVPHWNNVDAERSSLGSYNGNIVAINYFSILDLDYRDTYILSVLFREDGSSLFGSDERWHPYFRFSGAYRLTQDLQIPGISELKLRASYGSSGQRPGYAYQYEAWALNNGVLSKNTLGNSGLKASQTNEFEVGLDLEFLKHFYLEFVYSNSLTKDAIALAPLPSHSGYPYQWKNVGEIHAEVFELSLGASILNKGGFSWNANFLFDRVRQQIGELDIPDYKTGPRNAFYIREGEIMGTIYGYRWLTSLDEMEKQLPDEAVIGDYELNSDGYVVPAGSQGSNSEIPVKLDLNGDGNPDIVEIGDGNPDFKLSLSNTFRYKGFTLYALFSAKIGGNIYNYTRQYMYRDFRAVEIDQYGKPDEEKKAIDYYSNLYNNTEINSHFIEEADFLKLRELSLSYELTSRILPRMFSKTGLSSIILALQGRNLLTWTKYSGYDPEVASGNDWTNYPFDDFSYPNFRTYSMSITVKF